MGKRKEAKVIDAALDYFESAMGRKGRTRRENNNLMDYDKMFHALIGDARPGRNGGTGYHYRPEGYDFPGRRVIPGTERPVGKNGVYEGAPEYETPNGWQPKAGNGGVSTFFPKDWSAKDVDLATSTAFRKSKQDPANPNMWIGEHNGVRITGYYSENRRGFTHGFPHATQPD